VQRRGVQRVSLLVVVLLATVLRVYQLKDVPAGLYCDEAALGYDAYSIATAGMDENGNRFPLFFWSFGVSYKNPVFVYAAALPVKLLGLDEFSIRLTSALFGVGTVIAIFFLGRALAGPWVGLFAAIFLSVCPWHLQFSRIAFELISFPFLFVIGVTLLVRFTQGRRTLPAAMFFCGMCPYAYAVADLFVPLFLGGFTLLYLPTLWRRWRESVLALAVLLLTAGPAMVFLYRHQGQGTQYFRNTTMLHPAQGVGSEVRHLWQNYQAFFSRSFLLEHGDPIVRHAVRTFGELLPVYLPFLLLGVLVAAVRRDRASKLVLWWLALYPIAPSLMTEIPSASRGIIGAPAFCLLAALGLGAALRAVGWAARWRPLALAAQAAGLAAVGYFLVPQVARYLHAYFVDYPKYSAPTYGGFQYGYRDAIHYMESQRSHYDLLMLTAVDVNQPQIFPLFYNHPDPRVWSRYHRLGYLIIDPAEYGRYTMHQRILAAVRPADLNLFSDYTIKRRIVAPGGQEEFVIAELRARKHYLTHWQVLGLFLNNDNAGTRRDFIDIDHLSKNRYRGAFGDIYWRQIIPQFVRVDLNRFYAFSDPRNPGNPEHVCAYAAITVHPPAAQSAFLELGGSDDYMQGWLNSQTLTPFPIMLGPTPQRRPIDLNAGDNLLLLKSCENVGDWYFTARLTDAQGHDLPGITTQARIPETPVAPVVPTTAPIQVVEGFDSIVGFKHLEKDYPDYRGHGEGWRAYVHDDHGEVVWRTAPCPRKDPTVFVFTATTSGEDSADELYVNGTYALTFNTGDQRTVRNWERGAYHLTFAPKAEAAGSSGVMLLAVPAAQITPGQPVELRVIPARGNNDAWFMVKAYRDTAAHEGITPQLAAEVVRDAWKSQPTPH
jgi:4-amino-4-deoxy-L-arabinose transferase-like glycosyltransferase